MASDSTPNTPALSAEENDKLWRCMIFGFMLMACVVVLIMKFAVVPSGLPVFARGVILIAMFVAGLLALGRFCPGGQHVLRWASGVTSLPLSAASPAEAPTQHSDPTETPVAPSPAEPATAPAVGQRPEALTAARGDTPDDLTRIKGVGPKLQELCHELGFYHFDQIAAWTEAEVAWVDDNLDGFKGRVTRDDWVTQAKALAAEG